MNEHRNRVALSWALSTGCRRVHRLSPSAEVGKARGPWMCRMDGKTRQRVSVGAEEREFTEDWGG